MPTEDKSSCAAAQVPGQEDKSLVNVLGQVQKKITPWSQMLDLEVDSKRPPACPDLIIVASLIDRLPNLGGLCRTCEIFGAGKYVLNRYLKPSYSSLLLTWGGALPVPRGNGYLATILLLKYKLTRFFKKQN
jgi:tRNA G18 (ribose-2'-O)-methylase SpoU